MPVYTVHEPPLRAKDRDTDPSRFAFVRDGFHFWAFLLTPLWIARYRMWLVLIAYGVLITAVGVGLHVANVSIGTRLLVSFLVALLFGFEASSLRRWTLTRRGWRHVGVVVADDIESAERRFFDAWTAGGYPGRTFRAVPASLVHAGRTPDVIGLFPQPGAHA